jgi:hypothetical protein
MRSILPRERTTFACDVVMDVASHLVCDVDVRRWRISKDAEPERRRLSWRHERTPPAKLTTLQWRSGIAASPSARHQRTSEASSDATVEKWNRREHLGDLGELRVMRSVQVLAVNLTPRAQRTPRRIGPALLPAATITADDEDLSRHRVGGAVVVDDGERDLGAPTGSTGRLVLVLNEHAVGRHAVAE